MSTKKEEVIPVHLPTFLKWWARRSERQMYKQLMSDEIEKVRKLAETGEWDTSTTGSPPGRG